MKSMPPPPMRRTHTGREVDAGEQAVEVVGLEAAADLEA